MKRRITGAPKSIHRVEVNYTVEDIMFMEPIVASSPTSDSKSEAEHHGDKGDNVLWIRGVGKCHALRIYLRPKFGSFANNNGGDDSNDSVKENPQSDIPPMEKSDSLPLPPWDNQNSNSSVEGKKQKWDETAKKNVKQQHWGPILTFAIPCQSSDEKEIMAVH
eukprot:CAMPEP_0196150392 /NCGR_PEP_ID=MMETSP0910-20130528/31658_1 /TAXON_ID=49265 /ORGANISM="Thalassiosira rotula, Strain GSO102" /LENGTH=162 /DNA_ID=CAMNT_0041413509 /DNA_START=100 /DNA_END=585 /DNA_ORIENTATION=-